MYDPARAVPQPQHAVPQYLGILIPGGPARTDFVQASPSRLTLTLQAPGDVPMPLSSVSEVVCFLVPNAPVPPTHGLLVYWQVAILQPSTSPPSFAPTVTSTGFELLGSLTPASPSGIFRTNWAFHDQLTRAQQQEQQSLAFGSSSSSLGNHPAAATQYQVVFGVSMEPLSEIQNVTGSSGSGGNVRSSYDARLNVAQKIATDLFHFMQSFPTNTAAANNSNNNNNGDNLLMVPPNIFDRWLQRFEARYRRDPNFFMKTQD